jgi:integrase/recombinase XerD
VALYLSNQPGSENGTTSNPLVATKSTGIVSVTQKYATLRLFFVQDNNYYPGYHSFFIEKWSALISSHLLLVDLIILNTEETMDWTELIEAFLTAKQHTFTPNTLRAYRYDLTTCAQLLPNIPIREITVSHLRRFLDATADLVPTTLARRKAALRSCFGWAYQQDLLPADPTAKLEAIRIRELHPSPLTEKQVEAILDAIPQQDLRNRLLLTLLYETGMRVGEALDLQVQQVHLDDLDGGYLRVVGKKGNKERVIPLIDASHSVALLREVLKTLNGVGPLFRGDLSKGSRQGEAITYSTIWYHFERYVEHARSTHPERFVDEDEPITIHRLRHTYATIKLRDGVNFLIVSKLLGHTSPQTTQRYIEINLETIKRELVEVYLRKQYREDQP